MQKSSSRSKWVALVSALESSGKPLGAYALAHGLNPKTLAWWRWRLRKEREADVVGGPMQAPFLPVMVKSERVRCAAVGLVEASLPNGVVLRWEHRFDLAGLVVLAHAFSEVGS